MKKVLVLGGGGREHAIAWKLAQSASVEKIFVSPGSGGTAIMKVPNKASDFVQNVKLASNDAIVQFCKAENIYMVLVGPEDYLAAGITDALIAANILCFGPSAKAAQIEASKAFSKDFMARHNIPTARYQNFKDAEAAYKYIDSLDYNIVVKASGLAAGKGVIIPQNKQEAKAAVEEIMVKKSFGNAGDEVVIEEFLVGEEASFLAFTDGTSVVAMPPAQDHKRALDGDHGLNTGGMGAFAPSPSVSAEIIEQVKNTVLIPTVQGMKAEGTPFVGILYAGIILASDGPRVLEFNCRFGDPETQVLLPLLKTDLLSIAVACIEGRLSSLNVEFETSKVAATVVAASAGYPASYPKGKVISGLKEAEHSGNGSVVVFHAGTAVENDNKDLLVTTGGRVLAVTALGDDLRGALVKSYNAIECINFEGMQYRKDIGAKKLPTIKIAVLGSTRGTDMQAIIDAISQGIINAKIQLVVSNKSDAYILERAKAHNIPSKCILSQGKKREEFDQEVVDAIRAVGDVDLILLIGFMRILSPVIVNAYKDRILNVHPSLLPDFAGGMDGQVHEEVIKAGKKESGCTIHIVDTGVDTGDIVIQKRCPVVLGETADTLKAKVQALEGESFIEAIRLFQYGRLVAINKKAATYAQAGVNMERGDLLVEKIKPMAKATRRPGADVDLGGFGALFDLARAGFGSGDVLLVSGTDGVGTKLLLAQQAGKHDTIGIDLVAMCVNDVLAQGAEPLFFLDYFATGKLNVEEAASVVSGIARGCKESNCALVGGETAEMPGMYGPGHYDLAGFCVGAVVRSKVLPKFNLIKPGDVAIGLSSSGIHSNGFSLVRHLMKQHNIDIMGTPPFKTHHTRVCDVVLEPTRLYVRPMVPLIQQEKIKALAHITGGGILENIPRVLPNNVVAKLDASTWTLPPVLQWLIVELGNMDTKEALRTFNCGIGMVVFVDQTEAEFVLNYLRTDGNEPTAQIIGSIVARNGEEEQVIVTNVETMFAKTAL